MLGAWMFGGPAHLSISSASTISSWRSKLQVASAISVIWPRSSVFQGHEKRDAAYHEGDDLPE
jgi:hypothetical protein